MHHNGSDEAEANLQEHVLMVQKMVVEDADAKIASMATKMSSQRRQLERARAEKKDLLNHAAGAYSHVRVANERVARVNAVAQEASQQVISLALERDAALKQERASKGRLSELEKALATAKEREADLTLRNQQVAEISRSYASTLRATKKAAGANEGRASALESRLAAAESRIEEGVSSRQRLEMANTDLKAALEAQRHEALLGQAALERTDAELKKARELGAAFERQWLESLHAMGRRDEVLGTVIGARDQLAHRMKELRLELQLKGADLEEAQRERGELEARATQATRGLETALSRNASLGAKLESASRLAERQGRAAALLERENALERSRRDAAIAKQARAKSALANIHGRLRRLEAGAREHEEKAVAAARASGYEAAEQRIDGRRRAVDARRNRAEADMRQRMAEQTAHVQRLERDAKAAENTKTALERQNTAADRANQKLSYEGKLLRHALEHKEHELCSLRARVAERGAALGEAATRQMDAAIAERDVAVRESRGQRRENERLRTLWLASNKNGLRQSSQIAALDAQSSALATQNRVREVVNTRLRREAAEAATNSVQGANMAALRARGEARLLSKRNNDLEKRNMELEKRLIDSEARRERSNINHTMVQAAMRQQQRVDQQSRKTERQIADLERRSHAALQTKLTLQKEMLLRMQQERRDAFRGRC